MSDLEKAIQGTFLQRWRYRRQLENLRKTRLDALLLEARRRAGKGPCYKYLMALKTANPTACDLLRHAQEAIYHDNILVYRVLCENFTIIHDNVQTLLPLAVQQAGGLIVKGLIGHARPGEMDRATWFGLVLKYAGMGYRNTVEILLRQPYTPTEAEVTAWAGLAIGNGHEELGFWLIRQNRGIFTQWQALRHTAYERRRFESVQKLIWLEQGHIDLTKLELKSEKAFPFDLALAT